jgi:hypothetical protein
MTEPRSADGAPSGNDQPAEVNELEATMRRAALRLHRERIAEAQDDLLQSMAAWWAEAAQMRRFLAELRRRLSPESRSATMTARLEWAEAHVAALDPLSAQGLAISAAMQKPSLPIPSMTSPGTATSSIGGTWDDLTICSMATERPAASRLKSDLPHRFLHVSGAVRLPVESIR